MANQIPLSRLTGNIYRNTLAHNSEVFKKYSLGSGTYPYLLILSNNEGINQNQLSKELAVDKALSARVIKKLIDLEYIHKELNKDDSRAYQLFITDKAKEIIPDIREEIKKWNDIITQNLNEEEKEILENLLNKVMTNINKYKAENEEC